MRVLVFGTFDQLHPGHRVFLDTAQRRGELWIVVGLDSNVEKFKGRKPVQSQQERKKSLENAYPNAVVQLGDWENYLLPVQRINPDIILLGYDQELPPGVDLEDLPCLVERLPAHRAEKYKSSILRTRSSDMYKR